MGRAMTLRGRVERLVRAAKAGRTGPGLVKEVWLPAEPGGDPPGRYPAPSGWVVVVRYPPGEEEMEEVR